MHTVTPWSATAQEDIENSELLLERKILDYTYQFYNTVERFIWSNLDPAQD